MRLSLTNDIQTRDGSLTADAKLVNCYIDSEGQTAFVVKRPGLQKRVVTSSGTGLGAVSWEGQLYTATGSSISQTEYASIPGESGGGINLSYYAQAATGNPAWDPAWGDWSASAFSSFTYPGTGSAIYQLFIDPYGSDRSLRASYDGGASWTVINELDGPLAGVQFPCWHLGNLYLTGNSGRIFVSSNSGGSFADAGSFYAVFSGIVSDGETYLYAYTKLGTGFNLFKSTNGASWAIAGGLYANGGAVVNGIVFHAGRTWIPFYEMGTGKARVATYSAAEGVVGHDLSGASNGATLKLVSNGTKLYAYENLTSTGIAVYLVDTETFSLSPIYQAPTLGGTQCNFSKANAYAYDSKIFIPVALGNNAISLFRLSQALPYTTPAQTYSFTTPTAGLPLSWVGTSAGAAVKRLFIKNTERAWTLTLGAPGTLTQVTDPDYPATTVPGAVYLDGYFFVMDASGTIYNCDLENPTSWNSLNYITAEAEWDKGVAIAKHQNYVVALKDWTCEFFYDAANATGSPLSRVANATVQLGCAQGYSVVQFHGGLVFMSKTREKGRSIHIYQSDSIAPTEIATPAIQRILNRADLTSVTAWGGKVGGRVLYVLNLVTADITLVYDFTTQTWTQWTSDTSGTKGHFKCGYYATDGNRDFLLHESNGALFALDPSVYQDDGANIDVLIRTGRIDNGNMDRKTMSALTVVGDQSSTSVSVSYTDDDYQTFSTARTVSMSDKPPRLRRLGMFRRRAFDIRHADNTPLRLMAVDVEMEQGR